MGAQPRLLTGTARRPARRHRRQPAGVPLTRKEFDLLRLLSSRPGTLFTRWQILSQIWHDTDIRRRRTIDTHVSSLRRKLGSSDWVVTVRGVGFKMVRR